MNGADTAFLCLPDAAAKEAVKMIGPQTKQTSSVQPQRCPTPVPDAELSLTSVSRRGNL